MKADEKMKKIEDNNIYSGDKVTKYSVLHQNSTTRHSIWYNKLSV